MVRDYLQYFQRWLSMKVKKLVDSFNYAIEGIIYSIRTQRNMKIHMIATILVLSATFFYDLSRDRAFDYHHDYNLGYSG